MGLGPGTVQVEAWEQVGKSKGRKKKGSLEDFGCWSFKIRLMGSCISSRSKVDNSLSSSSTHCGNFSFITLVLSRYPSLLSYPSFMVY